MAADGDTNSSTAAAWVQEQRMGLQDKAELKEKRRNLELCKVLLP